MHLFRLSKPTRPSSSQTNSGRRIALIHFNMERGRSRWEDTTIWRKPIKERLYLYLFPLLTLILKFLCADMNSVENILISIWEQPDLTISNLGDILTDIILIWCREFLLPPQSTIVCSGGEGVMLAFKIYSF